MSSRRVVKGHVSPGCQVALRASRRIQRCCYQRLIHLNFCVPLSSAGVPGYPDPIFSGLRLLFKIFKHVCQKHVILQTIRGCSCPTFRPFVSFCMIHAGKFISWHICLREHLPQPFTLPMIFMTKMQEDELPDDDAVEEGADFACFLRIMQWMSDCSLVAAVGTVVFPSFPSVPSGNRASPWFIADVSFQCVQIHDATSSSPTYTSDRFKYAAVCLLVANEDNEQ